MGRRLVSLAVVGLSALGDVVATARSMQENFEIDQKRVFSSQIDVVVTSHGWMDACMHACNNR